MNVANLNLRWIGPSWHNCGPTGGQKGALAQDQAFQQALNQDYGQVFGENQQLMKGLTTNLNGIISAGPGQQGYSAPELATMNSQAINAAAAGNQKLQTEIGEQGAKGMSTPGVESGVEQAERAAAATGVDTALSNQEANITQQNYATGRQNYEAAVGQEEAAPGAFENPSTSLAGAVTGANQATGAQANQNAADSTGTELLGLGEGLASDAASAIGCVTPETVVSCPDGDSVARDLQVGDVVTGLLGNEAIKALELSVQPTVEITLADGKSVIVSMSHTFSTSSGGYTEAWEAQGKSLRTIDGNSDVVSVISRGDAPVIKIRLSGQHAYISNDIWSLE